MRRRTRRFESTIAGEGIEVDGGDVVVAASLLQRIQVHGLGGNHHLLPTVSSQKDLLPINKEARE